MSKPKLEPRVDIYIAESPAFAKPILLYLRKLIHKACPDVAEDMKWSRPFFLHDGVILCNMSAFKAHCSFGFWGAEMGKVLTGDGVIQDSGMGSLGRITALEDLPSDKQMLVYIKQAAAFIDSAKGESFITAARRVVKAPQAPVEIPEVFAAALKRNKAAAEVFHRFSPSCKREYVEWITDAKREETRDKRITQAVEWIAEGKQRNWKYQSC